MQEIKAFNEKRAEIYWWLSSVFANELSTQELSQYGTPEIRNFLIGLGENQSLTQPAKMLCTVLDDLLKQDNAQVLLAQSYYDLFLKCDQSSALPYASLYIEKSDLKDKTPAQSIAELMEKNGVHVQEHTDEPYDHLATELDFLGHLVIRSNELELSSRMESALNNQAEYIRTHLMNWVPQFQAQIKKQDTLGFYSAMTGLLVAFLELDLNYLAPS